MIKIYALTLDGTVVWVGASGNPGQRLQKHRWRWGQSIQMDILETCDPTCARDREKYWIDHYSSLGAPLRNAIRGGGNLSSHSEESRQKMSSGQVGNTNSVGKNIGNKFAVGNRSTLGRKHTAEDKMKMSLAQKARWARVRGEGSQ